MSRPKAVGALNTCPSATPLIFLFYFRGLPVCVLIVDAVCSHVCNVTKKLQGFLSTEANMAQDPFFPRFSCVLVCLPNQKRFFSVFKVSLIMMCESDSACTDVEMHKSHKVLTRSGSPD